MAVKPSGKNSKQRAKQPGPAVALSPEKQLHRLGEWHKAILNRLSPSSGTSTEYLVDQWEILEAHDPAIRANKDFLLRGETHDSTPPLALLFEYIDAGFYPPPELLLTLLDVWKIYLRSAGSLKLEDAFFGKPIPKGGNYAARSRKKWKNLGVALELEKLMDQGKTKTEAVIEVSERYGLSEESTKRIKVRLPVNEPEGTEK